MRITHGCTRCVILIGDIAIKIALFRPIACLRSLLRPCDRTVGERLRQYHSNPAIAASKRIFHGIFANLNEYSLYRQYPNLDLVPTLFSFFGLINIQVRGESIMEAEIKQCPFRDIAAQYPYSDLNKSKNFCRINGKIYLADYGGIEILVTFNQRSKILPVRLTA